MVNREDVDHVLTQFVDDSVVAVEQFPQSGILELRDISAGSREVLKHFHGSDDASGKIAGVDLGVGAMNAQIVPRWSAA